MDKEPKYWAFKHKPGENASEEECRFFVEKAIINNYALMQYEYGLQDKAKVTLNWNQIKNVKEGDFIFLRGGNKIYAYGRVRKPRKSSDVVLSMDEIIKQKSHGRFSSKKYNGVIRFKETDVFYEDLEKGCSNWGQRIKVDNWHYYNHSTSVSTEGVTKYLKRNGLVMESLYEIKAEFGEMKIKQLETQYQKKNMATYQLSKTLTTNYNLILTGAPGTGKNYLAKQIAQQMIFGSIKEEKDFTEAEKQQFKEQCSFVQFHPSYDYTDFVEGLRPIKDDNGNVGFERKDGVFKELCKKALKNHIDSQKSIEIIHKEYGIQEQVTNFLIAAVEGKTCLKTKTGSEFLITDFDENTITIQIPGNQIASKIKINRKEIFNLLENEVELNNVKDIKQHFHRQFNTQQDSYTFVICNEINKLPKITNVQNAVIEQKNFVFIIDEINRGEISKIFGELFFSIDPGYRGIKGKVKTQYQNMVEAGDEFFDGFYVPENVYIIGTMNDIDRSVESMDFAFRRRFAFKEIKAEDRVDMLKENEKLSPHFVDIEKRMRNLNNSILSIQGLGSAYQIGASYFLKLENYLVNDQLEESLWTDLWNNHIEGLLFEYLRGTPNDAKDLEKLKNAYKLLDKYNEKGELVTEANTNE